MDYDKYDDDMKGEDSNDLAEPEPEFPDQELDIDHVPGFQFLSINQTNEDDAEQQQISELLQEDANKAMLIIGIEKSLETDKIQTKTTPQGQILQYEIKANDPVVLALVEEHEAFLKKKGKRERVIHQQTKLQHAMANIQTIKNSIEKQQARLLDCMKNAQAQRILLQKCKQDLIQEERKKEKINEIRRQQDELELKRKLIDLGFTADSEINDIMKLKNPRRRKFEQ